MCGALLCVVLMCGASIAVLLCGAVCSTDYLCVVHSIIGAAILLVHNGWCCVW
jgi:hypothetical protein